MLENKSEITENQDVPCASSRFVPKRKLLTLKVLFFAGKNCTPHEFHIILGKVWAIPLNIRMGNMWCPPPAL